MTSLTERIRCGEAAITRAKLRGQDVSAWEVHLEKLKTETTEGRAAEELPRVCVIEEVRAAAGDMRAVKICSFFLEAHLWVLFFHDFFPDDDDAVFFSDELVFLKSKHPEQLQKILEVKRVFPRARVFQ